MNMKHNKILGIRANLLYPKNIEYTLDQDTVKDYVIEMLNVGAADAFIIYYVDFNNKGHLVLVDAGKYTDGEIIYEHLSTYYPGMSVDLAIVTHPDDDHYGGFVYLLEKLDRGDSDSIAINRFCVNNPQNYHVQKKDTYKKSQKSVNQAAGSVFDVKDHGNLIKLITNLGISSCERFASCIFRKENGKIACYPKTSFDLFPGCTVVGPTKSYFERLTPDMRYANMKTHVYENTDDDEAPDFKPSNICLSRKLDETTDDTSAHNQSSLMFIFEPKVGVRYLFTGDAGEEAFRKISQTHRPLIKNVSWMKIPHHGSKHNLTSKIINYCHPKIAFISTERQQHYLSQCTVNALKQIGCSVYSTHKDQSHMLINGDRENYEPADTL